LPPRQFVFIPRGREKAGLCGIIGLCATTAFKDRVKEPIGEILTKGLKLLEYRGYDSVGIAVLTDRGIVVRKAKGKVDEVSSKLSFRSYDGLVGVGHTRWATHGEPSDENAHPLFDCEGKVAVVHNGIIRNFMKIKKELESRHVFRSNTDTEVVAHLIEEYMKRGSDAYEAFKSAVAMLEGSYALAAVVAGTDKIFFAKKESPLVVAIGDGANFVSSDIPAVLTYTNKVIPLEDGEVGWVSGREVFVEKLGGPQVDYYSRVVVVTWKPSMASKGGYPHYMLKEIHEQPLAVKSTLDGVLSDDALDRAAELLKHAETVFITAAGTSFHAGLVAKHFIEKLAKRPVYAFIASEYRHYAHLANEETALLAISQSGETIDTIKALKSFKDRRAKTIALTNVIGSAIYREADFSILTRAGPEIGVAATKTFLTQVLVGEVLAGKLALLEGSLGASEFNDLLKSLEKAPSTVAKAISASETRASALAEGLSNKRSMYVLGRGLGVPLAMEGSLKIKEVSYIHAEAYPAGESKHGPIALVERGFPVIFVVTSDSIDELVGNVMEMSARGAFVISVSCSQNEAVDLSSVSIVPQAESEFLEPFALAPPLQLLAYYLSIKLGHDPDKPRNLAKTVTVE